MGISRKSALSVCCLMVSLVLGLALAAAATQATVLTNLGGVADGTLTGLAPMIQLRAPDDVTVIGPLQQYNIPLSSIRQISSDFPRLVIETDTGVVIGPYSAFLGIDELLTLETESPFRSIDIPFTSVRAISLHGTGLRAVPREWMGDHFLSTPEIVSATPLAIEECGDCAITTLPTSASSSTTSSSSTEDSTPIWNTITPETPIEEPAEFPWWLGLIGVGALVIIMYVLGSSSST